jgi:hypothetical protein
VSRHPSPLRVGDAVLVTSWEHGLKDCRATVVGRLGPRVQVRVAFSCSHGGTMLVSLAVKPGDCSRARSRSAP